MTSTDRTTGPLNIMIWNAARGGMRSVVEAYVRDGLIERENFRLIAAYDDRGVVGRQWLLLRALAGFLHLLSTRRIGLVHIHAAMRGSFWRKNLFAAIARRFNVPVVLHLHGSEMKPFYDSQPASAQRMIRGHLERAARVIVLSDSWRDFVQSIAPAAAITVVPNYVKVPPLPDVDARDDEAMLFLGMVGQRKGVWDLIPAMADVRRVHPTARLTIGGNGEVERAAALVTQAGLDNAVTLPGWIGGAEKAQLLARSGIYVLPSHNEGLPMSVLEAMAEGLAVVTTRVGGIPELITDGQDGLLIDAGDRDALVTALSRLLTDADLRRRLMVAGRARIIERYSDAAVLPQLSALYAEILEKKKAVVA